MNGLKKLEVMKEALERIAQEAYPESVFPKISDADFERMTALFRNNGLSMDQFAGNIARGITDPLRAIASETLKQINE